MKKLLLSLALAACAVGAYAAGAEQVADTTVTTITSITTYDTPYSDPVVYYNHNDVFKNKYFKVSYSNEKLKWIEPVTSDDTSCDFGVALDWGGMQNFTSRPIADMINIGLDIHLALAYANYKDGLENITKVPSRAEDKDDVDFHHVSAGIGIGPAVAVAPFAKFDNILQYLTVKAFYHFTPSYSALIYKDDNDDTATKGGFCLYQSFGLELGYRRLGIGIEKVNGSAKYSDFDIRSLVDDLPSKEKSEKQKIETPAFRVFVSYKF